VDVFAGGSSALAHVLTACHEQTTKLARYKTRLADLVKVTKELQAKKEENERIAQIKITELQECAYAHTRPLSYVC
jgi:C-terminal processing protease CtpA/Prc